MSSCGYSERTVPGRDHGTAAPGRESDGSVPGTIRSIAGSLLALLLLGCGGGGGGGDGGGVDPEPVEELLGVAVYAAFGDASGFAADGYVAALGWQDAGGQGEVFAATPVLEGVLDGTSYEVVPGSDPAVPTYFAKLTDGMNGFIVFGAASAPAGGGGYQVAFESGQILQRHPALVGPDLVGSTPTRLQLDLTQGSVVAGDPSRYYLVGLVSYYGTVP